MYMRSVKNTSLQGFYIPFNTPNGVKEVYLRPGRSIEIPDSHHSVILDNFVKRRMVKVTNVDAKAPTIKPKYK